MTSQTTEIIMGQHCRAFGDSTSTSTALTLCSVLWQKAKRREGLEAEQRNICSLPEIAPEEALEKLKLLYYRESPYE